MLGKSVFEIKHTMPISEYRGWQQYLALEPFGGENIQQALIAYVLSAVNGNKNAKLDDYIISLYKGKTAKVKVKPSSSQIKAVFGAIAKVK